MNKVYSLVWDAVKKCLIVTSEIARSKGRIFVAVLVVPSFGAWAGTCVQLDAVGSGSVNGTGSNAPVTCDTFAIAIAGGSGGHAAAYSISIGDAASSVGTNSIALGRQTSTGADNATALGSQSQASAANSTALGQGSKALETNAIAIGSASNVAVGSASGIAIGRATSITGAEGIAIGDSAAAAKNSISLGQNSKTTGTNSINFGTGNTVSGNNSGAIGDPSTVTGTGSYSLGNNNTINSSNAFAIGNGISIATGFDNSVVLGNGSATAAAVASQNIVINGATYDFAGSSPAAGDVLSIGSAGSERQLKNVAAGVLSSASTDAVNGSQLFAATEAINAIGSTTDTLGTSVAQTIGAGTTYDSTTGTISGFSQSLNPVSATGAVGAGAAQTSVGNALTSLNTSLSNTANIAVKYDAAGGNLITLGATGGAGATAPVTITNLAAGDVSDTSTDAVNGSQLFAISQDQQGATDALGTSVAQTIGAGTTYDSATGTISGFSQSLNPVSATGAVGAGAAQTSVGNALTSLNTSLSNTVNIAVKYDAAGGNLITLGATGGAGATAPVTITNLAAGEVSDTSTDAVNGSQLYAISQDQQGATDALGTSVAQTMGAGTTYNSTTGTISGFSQSLNPVSTTGAVGTAAAQTTVGDALASLNSSLSNTANIAVKYDAAGGNKITLGATGGAGATSSVTITNLAAGEVSDTSTDAVNGSQLYAISQGQQGTTDALGNSVAQTMGAGTSYDSTTGTISGFSQSLNPVSTTGAVGTAAAQTTVGDALASLNSSLSNTANIAVKYDAAGGNKITLGATGGAGAAGPVTITNLAAGTVSDTSTDAVNGSQLYAISQGQQVVTDALGNSVAQTMGAGTTYDSTTGTISGFSQNLNPVSATGAVGPAAAQTTVGGALASLNSSLSNTANIAVKYDSAGGNLITLGATGGSGASGPVTITNLAAGAVSDTSTDAVNGSQLYAISQGQQVVTDALGNSVAQTMGAGTTYDSATGTISGFSQNLNPVSIAGQVGTSRPVTTIGSALTTLNASLSNTANIAVKYDSEGGNQITLGAVAGQGATAPVAITNLAAGSVSPESLDAINGSQLYQIINNGSVDIKYFHVQSSKADSTVSAPNSIAIGPAASSSGAGAIALGNEAVATGDGSVALGSGSADNGRGAESYTGKYSGVANNSVGTVSVGNSATGELRTVSNVADAVNATDAVNLRQLDGAVSEAKQYTDTSVSNITAQIGNMGDIVNENTADINAMGQDITNIQTGQSGMFRVDAQDSGTAPSASGRYTSAGGTGSVASGESSTALGYKAKASAKNSVALGANSVANRDNSVSVGAVGSERQITNVAAGTEDTDAVNVGQLNSTVANINGQTNEYTNSKFAQLKSQLDDQDDTLSAGIASAMAMASMPQPSSPGGNMMSISGAGYRGESALALGMSHISENGRWVTKFQVTRNTQSDTAAGLGVGFQW